VTPAPRKSKRSRQRQRQRPGNDLWRAVPDPPEAPTVEPATDPAALIRSLGTPPLPGQTAVAEHYLAAVVERASGVATALAAAAGMLAAPDED
jgi:hypothetical protein